MSKFGKFVLFTVTAGTVAAVVAYVLQYKAYQKELEKEFPRFDGENKENLRERYEKSRNYTALKSNRDDFVVAAKDTANAAKGMASAAKEMIKDVANIISDNVSAASDVAKDSVKAMEQEQEERKAEHYANYVKPEPPFEGLVDAPEILDEDGIFLAEASQIPEVDHSFGEEEEDSAPSTKIIED